MPESLISSANYSYVVRYLLDHANLTAVVGMPESLFKTSGKGGTHTKTCLLVARKKQGSRQKGQQSIFFAEAKWCGNDSRGREIEKNDLPEILSRLKSPSPTDQTSLGYWLEPKSLLGLELVAALPRP